MEEEVKSNGGTIEENAKIDQARSLSGIGFSYAGQGKVNEALKYFKKALVIREELYPNKNDLSIAFSLEQIASAYETLGDIDTATEYQKKAVIVRAAVYGHDTLKRDADGLSLMV